MTKKIKPKNYLELCQLNIWCNFLISLYPLFLPELYNKGIKLVGDVLNSNEQVFTREELIDKTKLTTINPYNYLRLRSCINTPLKNTALPSYIVQKPIAPLNLTMLIKNKKGSKDFYNILQQPINLTIHTKWNDTLNRDIPSETWELIHKACFNTVKENYLIPLQFKIINQILGTRQLLHRLSILDNPLSSFCRTSSETISHLFFDCPQVHLLWLTLYNSIYTIENTNYCIQTINNSWSYQTTSLLMCNQYNQHGNKILYILLQ